MSTLKRKSGNQLAGSDPKKPKVNASITSFFGGPKPAAASGKAAGPAGVASASAAAQAPPLAFDKQKWLAKLTDEQRGLLELEIDTLHESWLAHLRDEITTKEFLELKRFLHREAAAGKKVFPPREDIYSWYGVPRRKDMPPPKMMILYS